MRIRLLPLYFIFISLLLSSAVLQASGVISENVDIHTFSTLITKHADDTNAQIIDVRTPAEFQASHIANALLIDFYDKKFIEQLEQLDKEKTYLLYCRSGNRSGKTLQLMKNLGFKAAYNMQGGMRAWTKAKYPVVTAR